MVVYVVMSSGEYTWDGLVGIFATADEARDAKRKYKDGNRYDAVSIHEIHVGSLVSYIDLGELPPNTVSLEKSEI